jgi:hypothetical protein
MPLTRGGKNGAADILWEGARMRTSLLSLLGAATFVVAASGQQPRELVERAIKAHGGADRLSRQRLMREQASGVVHAAGTTKDVTSETLIRHPSQFRNARTMRVSGKPWHITQVLDGDRGWLNENGVTSQAEERTLAGWREQAHAHYLATLTPLLAADKGYELAALDEVKINGRAAQGIKVSCKGHREVRLWFDRESGLLVRKDFQAREGGKEAVQEEVFSDFKEFDGLKRPTRVVISFNGVTQAELTITDVRFLDRVDDKEFARP